MSPPPLPPSPKRTEKVLEGAIQNHIILSCDPGKMVCFESPGCQE